MNIALKKWVHENRASKKLADHLDVSQPAIHHMMGGKNSVSIKHAKKIIDFTGLTAQELFPEWADVFKYSDDLMQALVDQRIYELELKLSELRDLKK